MPDGYHGASVLTPAVTEMLPLRRTLVHCGRSSATHRTGASETLARATAASKGSCPREESRYPGGYRYPGLPPLQHPCRGRGWIDLAGHDAIEQALDLGVIAQRGLELAP